MKQILRKTFLVLVAGIMSSAAWADTTLVGSANNTNDFWAGTLSEIYDIAPNKTLKLEFTSYIKADCSQQDAEVRVYQLHQGRRLECLGGLGVSVLGLE